MDTNIFLALVKQYFNFLFDEYGFRIVQENYYPELMGDANVTLETSNTGFLIMAERTYVSIEIGPKSLPKNSWFEFSDIAGYFASHIVPVYSFPKDQIGYKNILEIQIIRLSEIVQKYCSPILMGDFSMSEDIKKIEKERVKKLQESFNL